MLKEIIKKRRSIRKYTDEAVPRDVLEEICMYALMGPSYANARPVQFLIVDDKEKLLKLSEIEKFGSGYVKDAPLAIIVMADTSLSKYVTEECSIAASYLQLMAQDKGLTTSWINLREGNAQNGKSKQEYVKELFTIPNSWAVQCIIPMGYGNEKVRRREDFDVTTKMHFNEF